MVEGFLSKKMGDEPNEMKQALDEVESIKKMLQNVWTAEPVIVTNYNFEDQRVDVKLTNYPDSYREIKDIPIYNTASALNFYQAYETSDDPSTTTGDVGILLFMRTESRGSFDDRKLTGDHPPLYHAGNHGIFIPGPITRREAPPQLLDDTAGATDLDNMGPNDSALIHESGSHILFKENGEIVIKGTEVYFGDDQDSTDTFKNVARKGDAVGGDGATTIQEGSQNVKAGD